MTFPICIKWEQCQKKKEEEAEEDLTYRNMLKPQSIFYFDLTNCVFPFLTTLVTCKGHCSVEVSADILLSNRSSCMTFPFSVTMFLKKKTLSSPYYLVDFSASHLPVMMGAGDVVDSGVDGGDGAPVGEVLPSKSPLSSAAAALARFHTSQLP